MTVATDSSNFAGFDAFNSDEYAQEIRQVTPFAQIVNPRMEKKGRQIEWKPFGLAITEDNAKVIGFKAPTGWEQVEYQFSNGNSNILITTTPRVLVIHTSELYMKYRDSGKVIGKFNAKAYGANKKNIKCFTESFVLILDENNELAHEVFTDDDGSSYVIPLKVSLGGAAGARFSANFLKQTSIERSGFCADLEKAFSQFNKQSKSKPMNAAFHAHGVFAPTFDVDEVGEGNQTNYISSVVSYERPTLETLHKYLIPPKSELGKIIQVTAEKYKDYQPRVGDSEGSSAEDDGFSPTNGAAPKTDFAGTPQSAKQQHPVPEPFQMTDEEEALPY